MFLYAVFVSKRFLCQFQNDRRMYVTTSRFCACAKARPAHPLASYRSMDATHPAQCPYHLAAFFFDRVLTEAKVTHKVSKSYINVLRQLHTQLHAL